MGLIMRIYTRNIHSRRGFIFLKNKADLFSRNDTWVLNQPYYVVGYGYSQQYNVYVYVYTHIYIIIIKYIYICICIPDIFDIYIYTHQNLGRNIANYPTTQKTLENWDPHIMITYSWKWRLGLNFGYGYRLHMNIGHPQLCITLGTLGAPGMERVARVRSKWNAWETLPPWILSYRGWEAPLGQSGQGEN